MEGVKKSALKELVLQETHKKESEKRRYHLLLGAALIGIAICVTLLTIQVIQITGKASAVNAQGGYITELIVTHSRPTFMWGGIFGLVIRIPGAILQPSVDLSAGSIEEKTMVFDCVKNDAQGGPEIYASLNDTIDFNTLTPGDPATIDTLIGCSGRPYCAVGTFNQTMTIYLGSNQLSGIPSTKTYKYNGNNNVFDVGFLVDGNGKLVFVSHLNASYQEGYAPGTLVNYQMLLPTPENTTLKYYFFADPYDVCPAGGIGTTVDAIASGYVRDEIDLSPIFNATVTIAGFSAQTDVNGFYNLTLSVVPGTYVVLSQKTGYDPYFNYTTITFDDYIKNINITMKKETPATGITISPIVYGQVTDPSGIPLQDAMVFLGGAASISNSTGHYRLTPSVSPGQHPIISIKTNYDNYYALLNFSQNTTLMQHNIVMIPSNENIFPTGPYPEGPYTVRRDQVTRPIPQITEKRGEDFWISAKEIKRQVRQNTFIDEPVDIYNFKGASLKVIATVSPELADFVILDTNSISIPSQSAGGFILTIYGRKPIGKYRGTLSLRGDIEKDIPIEIDIVEKKLPIESILMKLDLFKKIIAPGSTLRYSLELQNLLTEQSYKVKIDYLLMDNNETKIINRESEEIELRTMVTLLKTMTIPKNTSEGKYVLRVDARYFDTFSSVSAPITVAKPLYLYSFFGIPLWIIFVLLALMSIVALNMFIYKLHQEKKKRYHLTLQDNLLPKPGPRALKIGKIAETNIPAYLDMDMMTTHTIVAGATGGGKSISAQVIVEEALMKNIAVVVFDPTAQWSGMLRKCEDKRMLSLYPKYGLKPNDAKGFPGNVRQVKNAREAIDIKKYISPGQIQVFSLNKLDPADIDVFVSTAIISVFRSGPEEHPGLRVLLVFDEVHRLLPKFGGTGKGFLQIERACREFRKWGFGVLLVSQVLSDFVGEIKANINTEMLMRVAEERDLERVKERYGPDALRSLVRADVGVGMVQNAEYNRGMPYFVAFRPILHNTRRLGDDVLEKYNTYNNVIEDIEYQIEQLEQEKIDVFDLKMELKLVKDKLMSGNFTVVDIYLEGLKPRLEKQWYTLGKKPKKREAILIEEKDISASLAAAAKERTSWQQQQAKTSAPVEEKKEDIRKKLVKSLTLDNGAMISSLQELQDLLPGLGNDIFKIHVNKNKNDIAKWITEQIDPALGAQIQKETAKDAIIKILTEWKPGSSPTQTPSAAPAPTPAPAPTSVAPVKAETNDKKEDKKKSDVKVKKK